MLSNIIKSLPTTGHAHDKYDPRSLECRIDYALQRLIDAESDECTKIALKVVQSAYISMTLDECAWEVIRNMMVAVNAVVNQED